MFDAALRLLLVAAWLGCLTGAAHGIGAWLVQRLAPRLRGADRALVALALGRWAFMAAAVLLGLLGALTPPLVLGLAAAATLATLPRRRLALRPGPSMALRGAPPIALLGTALLPALGLALAPVLAQDALQYQLALPARWLAHGGFAEFPHWYGAWFPAQTSLWLVWGMALPGELAELAASLAVLQLAAECAALVVVTARALGLPREAAWLAAGALLGATTLLRLAGLASTDIAAAWAMAVLLRLVVEPSARPLAVGLALGVAGAVKYTAAFFAAPLWLVWSRRRGWAAALSSALAAWALLVPWLLRSWRQGGHPLAPFFSPLLADAGHIGPGYGPGHAPLQILEGAATVFLLAQEGDGRWFAARFHSLPLLGLPALALVRDRRARELLLVCVCGVLGWSALHQRGAYLLAGWPLLCLGTGWGLAVALRWAVGAAARVVPAGPRFAGPLAARIAAIGLAGATAAHGAGPVLRDSPAWLPAAAGLVERDAWRRQRAPEFAAVQRANSRVAPGQRVAILWGHGALWADADTILTGADHQPYCRAVLGPAEGLGQRLDALLNEMDVGAVVLGPPPLHRARHAVDDEGWQVRFAAPAHALEAWADDPLRAGPPVFRFGASAHPDWQGIER